MVLFYYNKGSRGYHILHEVLPGFQGAVQRDGYGAYNELDNIKGIITIGCWAHARRKFEQALENDPVPARYAMLILHRTSCGRGTKTQHEVQVALQPYCEIELG